MGCSRWARWQVSWRSNSLSPSSITSSRQKQKVRHREAEKIRAVYSVKEKIWHNINQATRTWLHGLFELDPVGYMGLTITSKSHTKCSPHATCLLHPTLTKAGLLWAAGESGQKGFGIPTASPVSLRREKRRRVEIKGAAEFFFGCIRWSALSKQKSLLVTEQQPRSVFKMRACLTYFLISSSSLTRPHSSLPPLLFLELAEVAPYRATTIPVLAGLAFLGPSGSFLWSLPSIPATDFGWSV